MKNKYKIRKSTLRLLCIEAGVVLLVAIACLVIWKQKITTITITGSDYYTKEEIESYLFPNSRSYRTIYQIWNNKFGKKTDIPFIQKYEIELNGLHSVDIVLYQKKIIGYIPYMGNYLYFDTDGFIVEAASEKIEGIPYISGITFDYFVLGERLPVDDKSIFDDTLIISQLVNKNHLEADRIYFDKDHNITMFMGTVKVYFGQGVYLEGKMSRLCDIYDQIKGYKGILYLDSYTDDSNNDSYIFKQDQEETEQAEESEENESSGIDVSENNPDE